MFLSYLTGKACWCFEFDRLCPSTIGLSQNRTTTQWWRNYHGVKESACRGHVLLFIQSCSLVSGGWPKMFTTSFCWLLVLYVCVNRLRLFLDVERRPFHHAYKEKILMIYCILQTGPVLNEHLLTSFHFLVTISATMLVW